MSVTTTGLHSLISPQLFSSCLYRKWKIMRLRAWQMSSFTLTSLKVIPEFWLVYLLGIDWPQTSNIFAGITKSFSLCIQIFWWEHQKLGWTKGKNRTSKIHHSKLQIYWNQNSLIMESIVFHKKMQFRLEKRMKEKHGL